MTHELLLLTPPTYIYTFNHDVNLDGLFQLEMRQVFGEEVDQKYLFSKKDINPSISPFIKSRFTIKFSTQNYESLIAKIKSLQLHHEGFKIEYFKLPKNTEGYKERLNKLRAIGHIIEGEPNYENPSILFGISKHEDVWYFGTIEKHDPSWQKHKLKPHSFSNSLNMSVAKSLVMIASKGDKNTRMLDACCGVGTVLLEACSGGFNIEGCDINWPAVKHSRENLAHFGYQAKVYRSDIIDLEGRYDATIIDLPYNLYSFAHEDTAAHIINAAAQLSRRLILVSIEDLSETIRNAKLEILDQCEVVKKGKSTFTRRFWVCEEN